MEKNSWAVGKAYESPAAEAIELEPFDVVLYPVVDGTEDLEDDGEGDW